MAEVRKADLQTPIAETDPWAEDRSEALTDLVTSFGWREFAVPSLKARRAHIERQLALAASKSLEDLRILQAQWALIERILEKPREFFSFVLGG